MELGTDLREKAKESRYASSPLGKWFGKTDAEKEAFLEWFLDTDTV
jgi:hypothetical protein